MIFNHRLNTMKWFIMGGLQAIFLTTIGGSWIGRLITSADSLSVLFGFGLFAFLICSLIYCTYKGFQTNA